MDKNLIARRFAKAAKSYDQEATVQRSIVRHEISLLRNMWVPKEHPAILEIGCGTGFLTRELLAYQPKRYIANDLVHSLTSEIAFTTYPKESTDFIVEFLQGDAEHVSFPQQLDLIASCSAIQWLNDFATFLDKCDQALKPNGWMAFSTFGPENFREIRELTGEGLFYYSLQRLSEIIENHFVILSKGEEMHTMHFASPMDVLRHLRATGVTGTRPHNWNKEKLQQFCTQYEKRYANKQGGVTLTYHPLYFVAQKK